MKKILIQTSSGHYAQNNIFAFDKNNVQEPWRELKKHLYSLGYDLQTADDNLLDDVAWILFIDSPAVDGMETLQKKIKLLLLAKKLLGMKDFSKPWPTRLLYEEALKRGLGEKMALFLWEGQVNSPANYDKRLWEKFHYIFTWNDDLVDEKKFFKFFLPGPVRPLVPTRPFHEKKMLVNISANKYYPRPLELYSARAKTSAYWCKHYPNDFDLFGAKWERPSTFWQKYFPWLMPKYSSWRGVTPDRMETFSHYKFSVCYENLSGTRGYVTEKIFDALRAGVVPVYWGASNIEMYVDSEAFIDRRRFKNDRDMARYLWSVTEKEHGKMVAAGRKYIESDRFKKFMPEYFCDRIIEVLKLRPTDAQ